MTTFEHDEVIVRAGDQGSGKRESQISENDKSALFSCLLVFVLS
jgi:hypothetical protein